MNAAFDVELHDLEELLHLGMSLIRRLLEPLPGERIVSFDGRAVVALRDERLNESPRPGTHAYDAPVRQVRGQAAA